jgi:hypothetical protein
MLHRKLSRMVFLPMLVACLGAGATLQDRIAQDKEKFQHETDAAHKAKDFERLGDEQIAEFGRSADANQVEAALGVLTDSRKEAHETFNALKASGANAERKPEGYRQLQIHLRKSLWKIDRTLAIIPDERRMEVRAIRDDLADLEAQLIHELFPTASDFTQESVKG